MYLNAIAPSELTLTAIDQTNTTLAALEAELATGTTPLAVNPADTMIGTQMQGPLGMWSQTQQNLQQDQALLQTAGSATQSIQGVLQQMESLAVQASNGTNTPQNRANLQQQYLGLLDTIQQLSTVQYNGIHLLNPTNVSEISYAANTLPTEEITASDGVFNVSNPPPNDSNPIITAITFATIGTADGQGWDIIIHGAHFQTLSALGTEDVPSFSMVVGPLTTQLNATNAGYNNVWAQFGYTGSGDTDTYLLKYTQSSSTAITIQGAGGGYAGEPSMAPGHYLNFAIEGNNGNWALWQGSFPSVAATIVTPFPVRQLSTNASINVPTALTLPVVTPITLGLEVLSLATPSSAQSALAALQIAQSRLNTVQAQLGSQQAALQDQLTNAQTATTQLTGSRATLADANLATVTQQLAKTQLLNQTGLQLLVNEQHIAQQTAHLLAPTG